MNPRFASLSLSLQRLRGASNLKQDLPHFGDDDKDGLEVLDFVKYYDRHHNGLQNTTKTHYALHRRNVSRLSGIQRHEGPSSSAGWR